MAWILKTEMGTKSVHNIELHFLQHLVIFKPFLHEIRSEDLVHFLL